jgi:hypothetical protein
MSIIVTGNTDTVVKIILLQDDANYYYLFTVQVFVQVLLWVCDDAVVVVILARRFVITCTRTRM